MAVNLSFIGGAGWQFFDNNGTPLSGGKIYTYAAGTTIPLATYTARDGLTANANPIILDSAGRTPEQIWATEGLLYKYVVATSTDIVLRTWDNIGGSVVASDLAQDLANTTDNSKGDALIGFKQSDSGGFLVGATARTVNGKLQELISVKDFGAVGDGVTDDTAAIQAAIDAIKSTGNLGRAGAPNLLFPSGTYICASTVNIDAGHIRLVGENSTIQYTGAGNAVFIGNALYLTDLTAGYFYAGFQSIAIRCTNSAAKCVVNSGYRKIEFVNTYLVGGAIGLETEGCFATGLFYNSVCQSQSSHGINLKQRNNLFTFQSGAVLGAGGNGIKMSTAGAELKGIKLIGMDFEGCAGAINIEGNTGTVEIDGCWFENNTVYNIRVDNTLGTNSKIALSIRSCQITGAGVDVLIGTDPTGSFVDGMSIQDCEFNDSDLVLIGGYKVLNFYEFGNRFSGTATKTITQSNLTNVASSVMPKFSTAPVEPYGFGATGLQGELRYSDATGRVWLKASGGNSTTGWLLLQGQKVNDYSNAIQVLPTGTTPDIRNLKSCRTNNGSPTTITDFLNGYVTQELIIVGLDGGNTTVVHGANIRLSGGVNFTLGDNDTLHLINRNGSVWVEVSRSNNA